MIAEEKPPTRWEDFRDEMFAADPELRAEYENLGPRFDAVIALIRARQQAGLTQTELARRMGVSQGVLSRLESAWHSPRLETLAAAARTLGYTLEIRFKKAAPQSERKVAEPTNAAYREHYAPAWMLQRLRHRPPPDSGAEFEAIE